MTKIRRWRNHPAQEHSAVLRRLVILRCMEQIRDRELAEMFQASALVIEGAIAARVIQSSETCH